MILELGAELISSDAVALYELVKNGIDAGSDEVEIEMQVVLRRSAFNEALEDIEAGEEVGEVRRGVIRQLETGAPAIARRAFQRALEGAGDDPDDFETVLREAFHEHNWLEVRDTGHGMTAADLEEKFLTIGTRSRRSQKVDDDGRFIQPSRTILGDKGVGRLSAMRLGDHMIVTTSTSGERYENLLDIDWDRFSHESRLLIGEIELAPHRGERKTDPRICGTTITIRNLRGDWDAATFREMVEGQFRRTVDPFPTSRREPGWRDPDEIFDFRFNGRRQDIPALPQWLLDQAHAVVTAEYYIRRDGSPRLRGDIEYRLRGRQKQFELIEAELISLTDPIADRQIRTGPRTLRELGPFKIRFYWYNRRILKEVPELNKKRGDVLDEVNAWAGGLMVFRDFFRIPPYGGQDDDWLELDKKALSARGYKVNRSQIIGSVNLTARNHHLVEQTNREGFADNPFKQVLVGMLRHVLISEFRQFIENVDKEKKLIDDTTTDDLDERIAATKEGIARKLLELRKAAPQATPTINQLEQMTTELARHIDHAKAMAREYEDDRSKFVHLAGIGLMVEFILHEIGRSSARALDAIGDIDEDLLGRTDIAALGTLQDQLSTLAKRVDTLDPLSTSRRQTKSTFDIMEVVNQVVDGRSQQFARHGIAVEITGPRRPMKIKAVRGMLIQIIENLVENSVYWLKVEGRRQRGFQPRIQIEVDAGARELRFSDNGPGIAQSSAEEVFEPFKTSKPPGQGRGLGLYISRELARYHDWALSLDTDELNEDDRLSTFVLELGDSK
ncbi:sensor histidine kinase [Sphingomonas abietis]|uniref:histidine kinase n=1 Tax=Sphingomonas abietis TaxID=3012344 RepID=A0ABY7NRF4_9SPHN|nr:sensor histidine kinase [Sphingomonas abietis]WBO23218.1 sensor histidine kinase [Sphingomonas abietis]